MTEDHIDIFKNARLIRKAEIREELLKDLTNLLVKEVYLDEPSKEIAESIISGLEKLGWHGVKE